MTKEPHGGRRAAASGYSGLKNAFGLLGSAALLSMSPGANAAPPDTPAIAPATGIESYRDTLPNARFVVRLNGEINQPVATKLINTLRKISRLSPDALIELRINSPGGSVPQGLAIYDVMQSIPNPIATVCEGQAQSMAGILLLAGTPGMRYSYPHCTVMLHQPSAGTQGTISHINATVAEFNEHKEQLTAIIARHTGLPERTIHNIVQGNLYPKNHEWTAMGIVDTVIRQKPIDVAPKTLPAGFCAVPGRADLPACMSS